MAEDLSAQSKAQGIAFSGSGLWLRDGKAVWNAKRIVITGPGQVDLWEVWRYEFGDDARLVEVVQAERANYQDGHFKLTGLTRDHLSDAAVTSSKDDAVLVSTLLDPGLIEAHTVRPRQQATADLMETIRYARVNQLDALAFESAFWFRVFYPLICLALAFSATPFAFGNLRSGGLGQRLLLGMALGIGFYFGQRTLINLAETQRDGLILVNALPPLLLSAITWWALRRPVR
jgi:lipopolysaccharide export system permease protein